MGVSGVVGVRGREEESLCVINYTLHHTAPYHTIIIPSYTIPSYTIPHQTTPHHPIPHHTTPHHTIVYRTTPHHTAPHHTTPHHPIPYHPIPYHPIPYHPILYHPIPSYTIPSYTIPSYTIPSYTIPSYTMHAQLTTARWLIVLRMTLHRFLLLTGSSPALGSSSKTTSGSPIKAIATHNLRFIPPLNLHANLCLCRTSSSKTIVEVTTCWMCPPGTPRKRAKKYRWLSTDSLSHRLVYIVCIV